MLKVFRAGAETKRALLCGSNYLRFTRPTTASSLTALIPKRCLAALSKRELARLEDHVHSSVSSSVRDPVLDTDLASLDWLHRKVAVSDDDRTFHLLLRLPTLLHPELLQLKDQVKRAAEEAIRQWNDTQGSLQDQFPKINVEAIATTPRPMMAQLVDDPDELLATLGPGLANVRHIVAVYSCKGGVGKSTVSVNLAYELAAMGGRVGLLDLDVYGPSLPLLVKPSDVAIRPSPLGKGFVYPIQHANVKLLSLGFVNIHSGVPGSGQGNGASIMRGPMAGKVVSQLLKATDWGELDVLVLDLPPGTGDVQLQVLQDLQVSCSVAVSTPSRLAAEDTRKGIEMFTSLGVPTVAIVENMAYFECEGGGRHFPFGRGLGNDDGMTKLDFKSVAAIVQLPISEQTNAANDKGEPLCLIRNEQSTCELAAFGMLADALSTELLKMQFNQMDGVHVSFPESTERFDLATVHLSLNKASEIFTVRLFGDAGAIQRKVKAVSLRARDPKTGVLLGESPFKKMAEAAADDEIVVISSGKKNPAIIPTGVERRGRYGWGVQFSDGATIIYSTRSLAVAAGGSVDSEETPC